ncbi:winged helix family two component transcriptional regulator [Limnobacter thiooxidans]|uniref:Two-component system response regulator KdpE n=1 Tax=Limnobacter thiooxidans TaxID=131080 RepID=A0AA86JFA3_9BURK|nr:response regulator [Limnobacter sp.]MCZ8015600.1 response regulator [Limnobacter sp.]RZS42684.1 winged helix family two component transcriptional regulator [Limnobacter thiooxidans]BET25881.1 two-component system response regulator KdpE [Limnobacter thiooxidans]
MAVRILLIEDDRELGRALRTALTTEGHAVVSAASLSEARALLANHSAIQPNNTHTTQPFDLVLLDLGLPDGDGYSFLEVARKASHIPVIVISARPEEESKIKLLDAGADDYLVKPFSIGELLARIRVALRYRGNLAQPATLLYQRDGLHVDLIKREILLNGLPVKLTPTEYELLARLVRTAGQAVSHRQLLTDVWGPEYLEHTHYTRLYIGQLRAKIEANPADPHFILTETGVGYRMLAAD